MPTVPSRYRERTGHVPAGNRVKIGFLDLKQGNPLAWARWANYTSAPISSSASVERTWDSLNPGPPYRSGGSFLSCKGQMEHFDVRGIGTYLTNILGYGDCRYVGGFSNPYYTMDPLPNSNYTDIGLDLSNSTLFPSLEALGATVYERLRPRLEHAGLSVALAEARDIPRMMRTTAEGFHDIWKSLGGRSATNLMQPKKAANHFLNHQFGWVPFLSDLRKFYDVYHHSERYMREVTRNNNTWVKRIRTIENTESEELKMNVNEGACWPLYDWRIQSFYTQPVFQVRHKVITYVWCEGSFKYYRPEFDESLSSYNSNWNTIQRQLMLYGARINPSVVYKATPWTWLIDWFSNVGNTIDRAQDNLVDGMVSKYMYLMHHQVRMIDMRQTLNFKNGGPRTFSWQRFTDVKRREDADSPYGLRLSWGDLSPRQLGILAALGISRRRIV